MVSLICSIFSGIPIDWTNQFGLQHLGVTVFHCCGRMLWPGCRKVQIPLCKALIWDLIWSISDCSSWNLIWMLRTMNFYIWFEQSKLIPLFEDESGTLSLPDHCLFWPDQRLDVSQSKCKLGYPPVVKRGMLENPPFIEDGLLEFWNLHIYSGFSSTPCSCLHRKFLVLAGNDGHRDCLGHFWGDHWAHVSGGLARHWSSQTMADRTAWSNYCSEQKPSECAGMTVVRLTKILFAMFQGMFQNSFISHYPSWCYTCLKLAMIPPVPSPWDWFIP